MADGFKLIRKGTIELFSLCVDVPDEKRQEIMNYIGALEAKIDADAITMQTMRHMIERTLEGRYD